MTHFGAIPWIAEPIALYPPYDERQQRAGARTIPVVVLDAVG